MREIDTNTGKSSDNRQPPPYSSRRRSPHFFYHVPKTGGSTIHTHLVEKFGRDRVVVPAKNKAPLVDVWSDRKFVASSKVLDAQNALMSITGHFASFSIIGEQEASYYKVSFWRDPADWCLSYYNWQRHREKTQRKRTYSLMDLTKSFACNPMTQEFLLYCGDVPGWRYFFMSDRRKFDTAVSLARRFDLFADISKVDDYIKTTNLAPDGDVKRHNTVEKGQKAIRSLDEATRQYLRALNPVDDYIHRYTIATDKIEAIAEAHRNLSDRFQFRDVIRLIARPYHRLKVRILR
jgi:hypothetical protein